MAQRPDLASPADGDSTMLPQPDDSAMTPSPAADGPTLDPDHPQNWPVRRKWLITGFSCFVTFMIGINALAVTAGAGAINREFNVSDESFPNSYWAVTAWNGGAFIAPLIGLPLMENFGVRNIYLVSYTLFLIFVIPQAVAQNYATLLVSRFFAGGFGSIVQNSVANVAGDIWTNDETSMPVVLFIFMYLWGFTLGPTFGSAIAQFLDWRWIFYIQLILYAPLLPLAWLFIRETRASIVLAEKHAGADTPPEMLGDEEDSHKHHSEQQRPGTEPQPAKQSFLSQLYEGTARPAHLFFTEPVLFFFTLWSGLAVGNVFLASQSIAQTFGTNYGFDDVQAGYVEGALAVGELIGLAFCILQNRIYYASAAKNPEQPGTPIPEHRLQLSIPASFLCFGGGLFVYAWTSFPSVPWIAPTLGLGLVGFGIQIVVNAAVIYVTDAYGIYGGSAVAALASIENLFSAFLPLASMSMYTRLGFNWASSLVAFVAIVLGFAPVVLYLKGPEIRRRSKFMTSLH